MTKVSKDKLPRLGEIAVWGKLPLGLSQRKYTANRTYTINGITDVATEQCPVYRYAKGYERAGVRFSLFVFTTETDASEMESMLDTIAKKLKKAEIAQALAKASSSEFVYIGEK